MKKPVIGITSNFCDDDKYFMSLGLGALEQKYSVIANDYCEAVIRAGGIPVVIPVSPSDEYIEDISKVIDGLLISGGADIDPSLTGQRMTSKIGFVSVERDEQELKLLEKIYKETDKPILGICRGMQVLNAYLGGTLILDIPSEGFLDHTLPRNKRYIPTHDVTVEKDSLLYKILGEEISGVNSYHHQALKDLGKGLIAVANTEDGLVEAVEHEDIDNRFILAVQWHPEMLSVNRENSLNIFKKFVEECVK